MPAFVLPLTIFDESLLILQETRSAWNVQFEVGVDHPLDADRLGHAMRSCCQRHPMARARLAPAEAGARPYQWNITAEVDAVPLRVVDCPDATAFKALRTDLYTPPIALDASPGFRLGLARRPEGDLVLLSASHVVADGVGCVRLMQTIARAYRGQPDPPDPVPLAEARDVASFLAPKSGSHKWARELELLRRFHEALDPPSRIAAVGGADQDGFGFVLRSFDIGDETPALVQRPPDTTINDVLVAALHRAVQLWNDQHGMPAERIGVMMPLNIRPSSRFWDVVSNLTSMISVSTEPDDRTDLASAIAAVAEQTYEMRRNERAYGLYDLLDTVKNAPLTVKRVIPRLIHLTGDRFVDTAMLSNLGRLPEPPSFTDAGPQELWFSPPCDLACSVSIGVVTCEQRLSLAARYRYEQFGADAAQEFIDLLISQVVPGHGR
jgi:NRPS condensation-like uncharacterized protein